MDDGWMLDEEEDVIMAILGSGWSDGRWAGGGAMVAGTRSKRSTTATNEDEGEDHEDAVGLVKTVLSSQE
jgi:hypothetical protein